MQRDISSVLFGVHLLYRKPLGKGLLEVDGSILLPMLASWKSPSVAPKRDSWAAEANFCQHFPGEKEQVGGQGPLKP